jgi:hypothetical protein
MVSCASQPPPPAPPPPPAAPRPSPDVYFYPLHGQTPEQADRDRYDCYLTARQSTGFDPGRARPDQPPIRVVAVPAPGHDTMAGAATGAVIGAAVSNPWETAEGAAFGAVAGAVIGAASDASRQQQANRVQTQQEQERARADAQADAAILNYRRAMQACLEARGYSVR